jgi:hypothetical protein
MATQKFDSLFEQLLGELSPVGAEYETFAGSLKSGIGTAPGGGYLIGKLADALGKSKEEVVDMISKDLYDKVFPGGENPANNEDAYRAAISNAVVDIVKGIESSAGVKIPGAGKAVAGYTARVISQLGDAKKEYGARVSKQEVKAAVEDAEEASVENGAPAEPKAPKAARYMDEAEYEILTPDEMSAAGVELSDDLKTYYSRVENIADQVQKGKDLVKTIQRGGTDVGSATKAAAALIRAGAIKYASAANSDQDVEALEREDGDIEEIGRKEFEKSFGKVYKDYMASQPGSMNLGFED